MGTGYTRNDTANNIADGNVINASDLDGEFDAVQAAFNASSGHSHDGTTGEGPQIDASGIANNAVALGTKTTGNYVATGAVSGVGLSGSASAEGATFTVTSNATNANTGSTIVARDSSGNFSAGTITAALTGNVTGNVSGTAGSATGNAATATALETARNIGGVSFDGTGNIDLPGVNTSGNQNTSGNAATATALETARTIHGVSFDGTGNIDLSEVVQDTVGAMFTGNTETGITATYQDSDGTIDLAVGTLNQNTTGNAATATALETARTIAGQSFNGTGNITIASSNLSDGSDLLKNVVEDTTPQLGGDLDLNSSNITGTGNINNTGTVTTDGLTVAGNTDISGGTIKLDGSHPTGTENTALGKDALDSVTSGASSNVAIGFDALEANTDTDHNVAVGHSALKAFNNAGGLGFNTAVGADAMEATTTGTSNTAVGYHAMGNHTTGDENVAVGYGTLNDAAFTGSDNTAVGTGAGIALETGDKNTFLGYVAGSAITTGSKNTIIGSYTGNSGGLDIRTSSQRVVLSDGDGNIRLYVDSAGQVGIGNTAPQATLHVGGSVRTGAGSASVPSILLDDTNTGFYSAGTDEIGMVTGGTERVRIDSSGNVGIGTSSPSTALHVEGANGDLLTVKAASGSEFAMRVDGNEISFKADADDDEASSIMTFDVDGSETMRIDNTGRLAIAGTGEIINSTSKLAVHGIIEASTVATKALDLARTDGSGSIIVFRRSGGATNGTISISGSSTSYNTSSDYRLKEAVVDMTGAIDRVKALAPKRFNFIIDADTTVDGFLAHETQTVVPEAVTGTHNEVDDDGNAVYQGIDQSKLVPLLTGALQEAIAKIETLETKVAALEAGN
tara:strand:+ start:5806 stop:8364 length:2559 start_codon:yes stop_codon:yes gene_type:complete